MSRRKYRMRTTISDYERAIEDLMPQAEDEARLKVTNIGRFRELRPGVDGRTYNHCFFTQFFHESMTRLAIESGLRKF